MTPSQSRWIISVLRSPTNSSLGVVSMLGDDSEICRTLRLFVPSNRFVSFQSSQDPPAIIDGRRFHHAGAPDSCPGDGSEAHSEDT